MMKKMMVVVVVAVKDVTMWSIVDPNVRHRRHDNRQLTNSSTATPDVGQEWLVTPSDAQLLRTSEEHYALVSTTGTILREAYDTIVPSSARMWQEHVAGSGAQSAAAK